MTQLTDRTTVPADTGVLPVITTDGIDAHWLGEYLLGGWSEARKHSRELLLSSDFHYVDGLSVDEHRTRVLWQLGRLVEENSVHRAYPKSVGG
jgi:acyl-CoA oxidase